MLEGVNMSGWVLEGAHEWMYPDRVYRHGWSLRVYHDFDLTFIECT